MTATLQCRKCFWKAPFLWKAVFCVHSWLWKLVFYKCPVLLIQICSLKRDWWGWPRCSEASAAAARFWSGNLQLHFTQGVVKSLNHQHCQVVRRKWSIFITSSFCGTSTTSYLCESNNHLLLIFLQWASNFCSCISTARGCHVSIQVMVSIKSEYTKFESEVYSTLICWFMLKTQFGPFFLWVFKEGKCLLPLQYFK